MEKKTRRIRSERIVQAIAAALIVIVLIAFWHWYAKARREAVEVEWIKTFGGPNETRYPQSAQQTADGGYIIAGGGDGAGGARRGLFLIKANPTGKLVWGKIYGEAYSVSGR